MFGAERTTPCIHVATRVRCSHLLVAARMAGDSAVQVATLQLCVVSAVRVFQLYGYGCMGPAQRASVFGTTCKSCPYTAHLHSGAVCVLMLL